MSCADLETPPFWGDGPRQCARGECVQPDGLTCVCTAAGWTGRSDIVNLEGLNCQVFEPLVLVLWIVCLAFTVFNVGMSLPKLHLRWTRHVAMKEKYSAQGREYNLWSHNRGLLGAIVWMVACLPGILLTCLVKIAKPDERVGVTTLITVLFAFTRVSFYCSNALFTPALLTSIIGNRDTSLLMRSVDNYHMTSSFLAAALSFLPFFTLLHSQDDPIGDLAFSVWYAYLSLHTIQILVNTVFTWFSRNKLRATLDEALTGSRFTPDTAAKLRDALEGTQRSGYRNMVFFGVLYLCYTVTPVLLGTHDYLHPLSWMIYSLMLRKAAETVVTSIEQKTQSRANEGALENVASGSSLAVPQPQDGRNDAEYLASFGSFRLPHEDSSDEESEFDERGKIVVVVTSSSSKQTTNSDDVEAML